MRQSKQFASPELTSTLSSKGQITIPVRVRRHLGIKIHDKIAFLIDRDGAVRVAQVKYPTIQSLRGVAGSLQKTHLFLKKAIRDAREERLIKKYGKR